MLESLFEARDYEVVILLCQILREVLWAFRDEKSTCPHKELLSGREKIIRPFKIYFIPVLLPTLQMVLVQHS